MSACVCVCVRARVRVCMLGYFDVSIIFQTLTRTTGSLTCVCDLFACIRKLRFVV